MQGFPADRLATQANSPLHEIVREHVRPALTRHLGTQLQQEPAAWTGEHFTEPNEQNTQQSPGRGRSTALQFWHW